MDQIGPDLDWEGGLSDLDALVRFVDEDPYPHESYYSESLHHPPYMYPDAVADGMSKRNFQIYHREYRSTVRYTKEEVLGAVDENGNTIAHLRPYSRHLFTTMENEKLFFNQVLFKMKKNHAGFSHVDMAFSLDFPKFIHELALCYPREYDIDMLHPLNEDKIPSACERHLATMFEDPSSYTDEEFMVIISFVPTLINTSGSRGNTAISETVAREIATGAASRINREILYNEHFYPPAHEKGLEAIDLEQLWAGDLEECVVDLFCIPSFSAKLRKKFMAALGEHKRDLLAEELARYRRLAPDESVTNWRIEELREVAGRPDGFAADFFALIIFHCDGFTEFASTCPVEDQ